MTMPAMRPYVLAEHWPGPGVQSDDEILQYCREVGSTIYHPSSSCRMGIDDRAVVDPRLKVYGVDGLRVVDGAIMPGVVSGNTNAAIVMIGEKGADMILEDADEPVRSQRARGARHRR